MYRVSQLTRICLLVCFTGIIAADSAKSDVSISFELGILRNVSVDPVAPGTMWALVVAAPGSRLPGGLAENSSIGVADVSIVRADFGGATITKGTSVGGAMIVATGQVSADGFAQRFIQWTNEDYQVLQAGGLLGLYWFPGILAVTAVLPESGFAIGGMQETTPDPDSGGNAGMIVPANNGQSITVAFFDAGETGSSSSLPMNRFTAIEVPASGYMVWREQMFSASQIGSGDALPDADPDRDGLVNLLEYATGSLPLSGGAGPLRVERDGADVVLRFKQIADPELLYRVEATDDLAGAVWLDVVFESSGEANEDGLIEISLPIQTGKRFFRLRVDFVDGAGFDFVTPW
jgi:hypothetical protein